jgi:hypothetical protein
LGVGRFKFQVAALPAAWCERLKHLHPTVAWAGGLKLETIEDRPTDIFLTFAA